jgi:hypothetical protein
MNLFILLTHLTLLVVITWAAPAFIGLCSVEECHNRDHFTVVLEEGEDFEKAHSIPGRAKMFRQMGDRLGALPLGSTTLEVSELLKENGWKWKAVADRNLPNYWMRLIEIEE